MDSMVVDGVKKTDLYRTSFDFYLLPHFWYLPKCNFTASLVKRKETHLWFKLAAVKHISFKFKNDGLLFLWILIRRTKDNIETVGSVAEHCH